MEECFLVKSDTRLRYVEIVVTTACTLKCRDCANLISFYDKTYQIDYEVIVCSMDRLLSFVDKIEEVGVLGGEPFLYPWLGKLINYLCGEQQIERVRVVTNGTVVPIDFVLMKSFQDDKVHVQISDYPNTTKSKANEVCDIMKLYNVNYLYVNRKQEKWRDYGTAEIKAKSLTELENQYSNCNMKCRSLLNGKLYFCPRSAHGNDLGIIKENAFVDLLDNSLSQQEMKNKLHTLLYDLSYIMACKICNAGTKEFEEIDAAIQFE